MFLLNFLVKITIQNSPAKQCFSQLAFKFKKTLNKSYTIDSNLYYNPHKTYLYLQNFPLNCIEL